MQISEIDLKLKLISCHLLKYALPRFRVLTVYILYSYPCTLICSLFISLLDQFAAMCMCILSMSMSLVSPSDMWMLCYRLLQPKTRQETAT